MQLVHLEIQQEIKRIKEEKHAEKKMGDDEGAEEHDPAEAMEDLQR